MLGCSIPNLTESYHQKTCFYKKKIVMVCKYYLVIMALVDMLTKCLFNALLF